MESYLRRWKETTDGEDVGGGTDPYMYHYLSGNPTTDVGKRQQIVKMLAVVLIPICMYIISFQGILSQTPVRDNR